MQECHILCLAGGPSAPCGPRSTMLVLLPRPASEAGPASGLVPFCHNDRGMGVVGSSGVGLGPPGPVPRASRLGVRLEGPGRAIVVPRIGPLTAAVTLRHCAAPF